MKKATIIGMGSEIAQNIAQRLVAEGWVVTGCSREHNFLPAAAWDLALFARGTMEPIGDFFHTSRNRWERAIYINALDNLTQLRAMWGLRRPGAKVVFLHGPNMNKPNETYSAYRCGKAILEAIVPTLNAEYPEHKFLMLRTGVVRTKFHQQTIAAGKRAANLERVQRIVNGEEETVSHDEVFARLKELIK